MAIDIPDTDDSPFPSHSMMDLDMLRAGRVLADSYSRRIESVGETVVAEIAGTAMEDSERDVLCRRIEMMGDVYETLRKAAAKLVVAGVDASEEHEVLAAFVSPKPFGGM